MYENLKHIVDTLPELSGVYQYLNQKEEIIYVGKAKNLRNRLASYFGDKKNHTGKTKVLVRNADHIEFMIVETEHDALVKHHEDTKMQVLLIKSKLDTDGEKLAMNIAMKLRAMSTRPPGFYDNETDE